MSIKTMRRTILRSRFLFGLGVVFALGCSDSKYQFAPVSGTVTMDGKPLPDVVVNFQPLADKKGDTGPGSTGRTDQQGHYTVDVIGLNGKDGAVLGTHKVLIMPTVEGDPGADNHAPPKVQIPARYSYSSELKFDVKPGNNSANFDLKSR